MVNYRRKVVIENLMKYNHKNILEIGCGFEPIFKYFTDYSSITVVEPGFLFYKNACKIKDASNGKNIFIFNELFENVSNKIKTTNFDFIIISSLLHELASPNDFLKEVFKVCTSNTIVHINVPNADSFHRILAIKSGIINNKFSKSGSQIRLQQYSTYNQETLINQLTANKFKIIDKGSYFIKPFTHVQMQMLLDNQIINDQVLDGLFKITDMLPDWGAEIFVNAKVR
jgi:SAM-dependent methyltransferase